MPRTKKITAVILLKSKLHFSEEPLSQLKNLLQAISSEHQKFRMLKLNQMLPLTQVNQVPRKASLLGLVHLWTLLRPLYSALLSRIKAQLSLVRLISSLKPLARHQSKSPLVEALAPHRLKSRCHLRPQDLQLRPEELSSSVTLYLKAQARCSSLWASAMPHLKAQASHSLWALVRRLLKAQARFSLLASEANHLKCLEVSEVKPNQLPKTQPQGLPSNQEALGNLGASELQLSHSKALEAVVPSILEVSLRQCPQPCWNQGSEELKIK